MADRIADSNIFSNAIRGSRINRSALNTLQNQIITGKRLNSLADDPRGSARVLGLKTTLDRLDQFERNIGLARATLETTEVTLRQVTNTLVRIRELAVSADVEDGQFPLIAEEIQQRFGELLATSNTRVGGRFIFGGFVTDSAPVSQTGVLTDPTSIVSYNGDSGQILVQADESSQVQINVTARELFFGSTDNDDLPDGARVNIFDTVQDLYNRLIDPATNGRPTDVLNDLDAAINQVNQVLGSSGARSNRLDSTIDQIQSLRVVVEQERSFIEDADLVEVITDLQSRETTLQATLSVTGRIIQPSLLNFLG